ncbi:MAG TPA: lysylphosphatidylglycerol synthase transmembrane domain-containing protein [Candidatus Tectomicrobia bacterium]|nr:lysylphosphatidylglycerol synthase transmembrane domain-containing protein [Candidatus Tectomicrobia bacterium]
MSRLRVAAGLAVSGALAAWLLARVDLRELGRLLASADWWWTLPALALAPVVLWLRAIRWRYLFPPRFDPPGLVAANMIGYMANNLLPLRAGELVRVYVVGRRLRMARAVALGEGMWLTAATLLVERIIDSVTIVLILGALVLVMPIPAAFRYAAIVVLGIDAVAAGALVALAARPEAVKGVAFRLTARWPAVERRVHAGLDLLLRGLEGVRARGHLAPLLGWTVVVWTLGALAAWTLTWALHLDVPFLAGWTIMTFVAFGVSIPSAPGYVGVWHAAAMLALTLFGVPDGAALGYAILYHASQYVPITLIGWGVLLREHVTLGEATGARVREPA